MFDKTTKELNSISIDNLDMHALKATFLQWEKTLSQFEEYCTLYPELKTSLCESNSSKDYAFLKKNSTPTHPIDNSIKNQITEKVEGYALLNKILSTDSTDNSIDNQMTKKLNNNQKIQLMPEIEPLKKILSQLKAHSDSPQEFGASDPSFFQKTRKIERIISHNNQTDNLIAAKNNPIKTLFSNYFSTEITENFSLRRVQEKENASQFKSNFNLENLRNIELTPDLVDNVFEQWESLKNRLNQYELPMDNLLSVLLSGDKIKSNNKELKDAVASLDEFLKRNDLLVINSDRIETAKIIFKCILFPETIKQNGPVCGVDICLRRLAEWTPERFVYLAIQLAEQGESNDPFPAKLPKNYNKKDYYNEQYEDNNILFIMMNSVRNSTNHFLVGHQPGKKDSSLIKMLTGVPLEIFSGATLPRDLEFWYEKAGFEIIEDNIKIFDKDWNEMPLAHRASVGGVYSNKHIDSTPEERISHLKDQIKDKNLGIDLLISQAFTEFMEELTALEKILSDIYSNKDSGSTPEERIALLENLIKDKNLGEACTEFLSNLITLEKTLISYSKHQNKDQKLKIDSIASLLLEAFPKFMLKSITQEKILNKASYTILGGQGGHYVKLVNFSENEDRSLNMTFNTYGALYEIKNLPREFFAKHCFGSFVTRYTGERMVLQTEDPALDSNSCTLF